MELGGFMRMKFLHGWAFVISPSKFVHLAKLDKDDGPVTQCCYPVTHTWTICDFNDEIAGLKRCQSCESWRHYLIHYLDKPPRPLADSTSTDEQ
jgi:hypothetical protein